jgi:hypothetical protein
MAGKVEPSSLGKLTVTVTPTSDNSHDYIQIMSEDMVSVNIVLVADEIEVKDTRAFLRGESNETNP